MLKKVALLFVCLWVPFTQAAPQFKENVNYEVIQPVVSAQPEVMEYFSFFCPHCYRFEPVMEELQKQLPQGVTFKQTPVAFIGGDMGAELQRAYAASQLLSVKEPVSATLFRQIHEERKQPGNRADIRAVFVKAGIDGAVFDKTIESKAVTEMVAEYNQNTRINKIDAVPMVIVNKKYRDKTEGINSAEEYFQLINFLAEKRS